jgi:4-hydroxy-tetrahydrodipicolinate reductase
MKIFLMGISGKMGQRLLVKINAQPGMTVIAGGDQTSSAQTLVPVASAPEEMYPHIQSSDLVIDFSLPKGTETVMAICRELQKPLLSGTTGLTGVHLHELRVLAETVPVMHATNFSTGVAMLNKLSKVAAAFLPEADIEIVEKHHRYKKDAPSGTAETLAQMVKGGREVVYGRSGESMRKVNELTVHSIRGGNIVGEHEISFILDNEVITVSHSALNRDIFVDGAIAAAKFLVARAPGFYTIEHMFEDGD